MPIEISSFLGGISNSIYSITGLNHIFSSVLYTALGLSIVIIIIIMLIYPCKKDTPLWLLFKTFLYIMIVIMMSFSIHSNFIRNNYKEKYLNNNVSTMMNNTHGGVVYVDEKVDVRPRLDKTYEAMPDEAPPQTLSDVLDDLERRVA